MWRHNCLAPKKRSDRIVNLAANLLWAVWWLGRACVRGLRRIA